jgi:PAS domain S-box-containing protein
MMMDNQKRKGPVSPSAVRQKITRLEKELEACRTESLFFQALFDGTGEEIMVVDRSFIIRDANRSFLKAVRLRKEEVLGRKCYEIKEKGSTPSAAAGEDCPLETEWKSGDRGEASRFPKSPQGMTRGCYLLIGPIESGPQDVDYLIGIARDASGERQIERRFLQSERLAAVGQAVAHVAHELRNPLMIIGGFAGQIRRSLKEEKDGVKMDMILDEVKRLERLVSGLGDFTKTYRLVKRPTDLADIIQDVIKIMAGVYPPDKYSFIGRYDRTVGEIDCDPDKLKQVFINLFSNGCEAMPQGGRITIAVEQISGGIEIRIQDEGVGIPEEQIHHLFEPFYTTREKGLGLGLSISYKIIQAHDGEIYAESRPGLGTTFIIRLPS